MYVWVDLLYAYIEKLILEKPLWIVSKPVNNMFYTSKIVQNSVFQGKTAL